MDRQTLPQAKLTEILIAGTSQSLGRDASFIGALLVYRYQEGEPNWDAHVVTAAPNLVRAFASALTGAKKQYDLD
jgi:hypothetical protein